MTILRACLLALGVAAGLALAGSARAQPSIELPDFGDPSLQYLSHSDERRLGSAMLHKLRDRGALLDDVQASEYLNAIGQRLALNADQTPYGLRFFWLRSPTINAFAAPGGYIAVNAGLMLATRNEDELAGVLAHEIAHVSQRHLARAYAEAQRLRIPMAAALIASALIARASSEAGQAAFAGTLAAGQQYGINYTRANEEEADRFGVQFLARAGFDPNGMYSFFERLTKLSGGGDQVFDYLRTHPRAELRAADVGGRALPRRQDRSNRDSLAYPLAKARIKVLSNPNSNTLIQEYGALLAKGGGGENETELRYGYTLALKRAGRYAEAEHQLEPLLRRHPDRLSYLIEQAELALARGQRERAWQAFEKARSLYADDYTLAMHYGSALTTQGDARKAMSLLQPQLRRRADDANLQALYAQAAQRAGQIATAYAAMAEYHYLNGDLELAIRQAEQALREPSATPYQQAQVQARLRQFKEEYRAEQERETR
ncbi:MAG TPA: M48 family metalloprotease [Candidatus Competibacteraceae bacterium]|nr:M48 family metalloprotease [Candidatus Competibacteraceae bacterium]